MNLDTWRTRAEKAMPAAGIAGVLVRNGAPSAERASIAKPGDTFEIPASR